MNIYQLSIGQQNERITSCMAALAKMAKELGFNTFVSISDEYGLTENYGLTDLRCISDVWRVKKMIDDPWGLYGDTDFGIDNWKNIPSDGKPRFYPAKLFYKSKEYVPEACVIFGNGNADFFKNILADFGTLYREQRKPGWLQTMIRSEKYRSQLELFPIGQFTHLFESGIKTAEKCRREFNTPEVNGKWVDGKLAITSH